MSTNDFEPFPKTFWEGFFLAKIRFMVKILVTFFEVSE